MRNQGTIKNATTIRGIGLHSGDQVTVTLLPAEPHTGVVFYRTDLPGRPDVPFHLRSTGSRERQTALVGRDQAEVQTVEHLVAGLHCLGIDNARVEINGPEVPGMDGSGLPFAEAIQKAGRVEQKAPRKHFRLDKVLAIHQGDASLVAYPKDTPGLRVTYTVHFPELNGAGTQTFTIDVTEDGFLKEIAPARTFCLEAEALALRTMGIGKGATTSNTLVLQKSGPIDNTFRFPEELARHKILDLLGDLALLGADLQAHVVAHRTGHRANRDLVSQLAQRLEDLETRGLVQSDTGLDVREILKIIPHRYPFLFVDRVVEFVGYQRAVGIKCVSFNEPYFQGHWPGQPIMPGVLQVEALAQLSGVLLLRRLQNTGKVAVLLAIDKIKFRRPVVPGDVLRLECETLSLKNRSGKVRGRATVNGELTCESVMKFMMMDA
ncbi:MAG TPA: UDP-3-O-acyl-N-acetylglucosamine deacetylase [Planctomycetota bacterium]|nr:UDP-3-O-acyl-N-acetylglucosamine deacetylase [Planctomycetota bacterium]